MSVSNKTLVVVVAAITLLIVVGSGYVYYTLGTSGTEDPTKGEPFALTVPVIVTPSLQLANGQVLLVRATNLSGGSTSFRMMFFGDDSAVPIYYEDYEVAAGRTVSHVYRPPTVTVQVEDQLVEAPQAVRATFAPIPATDDPGTVRGVVANVQIMRVVDGPDGAPVFEAPIVVPLSRCNYEPRSKMPGGNWYWNCATDMYPRLPLPPS
ncbi:MAG: hypothetical protein FJW23_12900 [Acidimicrobiia bacterium]|nr:hypothetical protein [Acidimicrobiia bacterium]